VAGDVDELALARHVGVHFAAGALRQVVVGGSVDDDRLETKARHDQPADRVTLV
jgi:hypothetical protein